MVSQVIGFVGKRQTGLLPLIVLGLFVITAKPARAFAGNEALLDSVALVQLEQHAEGAQLREQCFLYTELLHDLTEVAGKQISEGQEEQAASTLRHMDLITAKIQQALARDAKRLKNAEMLMEHTTRRLTDMLHITSGDEHVILQSTLQHVSTVHTNILGQVFAK